VLVGALKGLKMKMSLSGPVTNVSLRGSP